MEKNELLSRRQCENILKNFTNSQDFVLKSFSVTPLYQLNGLIAQTYTVSLRYLIEDIEKKVQFFSKILDDSNPVMFRIAKEINAYEKEAFLYEKLLPLFKSSGLSCDYAPKSYFCEPFIVVLEDLSLSSYRGLPKNKSLNLYQCNKCLETLAKFHVVPILYEVSKSKELGRNYSLNDEFGDILKDIFSSGQDNGVTRFYKNSIHGICQLIDLLPEKSLDKEKFKLKLSEVLGIMLSRCSDETGFRSTVLHGDLWCTNFLCQYEDTDRIKTCKLIDFQTITYGPPAVDVLQFILTNTRKSFRERHQDELLTYYYNYFAGLLEEHGLRPTEILTQAEFRSSCDVFQLSAKIFSVVDRCITFTSDDNYVFAAQCEERFEKFLYEDRSKFIINNFKNNSEFRELMTEDINELKSMLFSK